MKRAIQLRDIVTSLGPAYIKVCITEAVQGQQVVCVCVQACTCLDAYRHTIPTPSLTYDAECVHHAPAYTALHPRVRVIPRWGFDPLLLLHSCCC